MFGAVFWPSSTTESSKASARRSGAVDQFGGRNVAWALAMGAARRWNGVVTAAGEEPKTPAKKVASKRAASKKVAAGPSKSASGTAPTASKAAVELGRRLRARRLELELNQVDLERSSGLVASYIGQVERGQVNVTLHNLLRLAGGLKIDPGELVTGLRPPPRGK